MGISQINKTVRNETVIMIVCLFEHKIYNICMYLWELLRIAYGGDSEEAPQHMFSTENYNYYIDTV